MMQQQLHYVTTFFGLTAALLRNLLQCGDEHMTSQPVFNVIQVQCVFCETKPAS